MLLKPDVEEELSRLIGDTPAHQALRFVARRHGRSAGARRPPACATWPNTSRMSAATWCRAPRPRISTAASNGCAKTSTGSTPARDSSNSANERPQRTIASDETARHRPAHRNPARAGAPRAGRVRARHAPLSPAALPVPAQPLDLGGAPAATRRAPSGCAWRSQELGPDLREVRPGAVDAPRPAADRHRRGAGQAPGSRAALRRAHRARASSRTPTAAPPSRCSRRSTSSRWPPHRSRRCTPPSCAPK